MTETRTGKETGITEGEVAVEAGIVMIVMGIEVGIEIIIPEAWATVQIIAKTVEEDVMRNNAVRARLLEGIIRSFLCLSHHQNCL